MNALDEHGRQIPDQSSGTGPSWFDGTYQPYCVHGWTYHAIIDGREHRVCALCNADLGLANYFETNSPTRPRGRRMTMTTAELPDFDAADVGARGVAFGLAVAACMTLNVEITAERLRALVDAFVPVLTPGDNDPGFRQWPPAPGGDND